MSRQKCYFVSFHDKQQKCSFSLGGGPLLFGPPQRISLLRSQPPHPPPSRESTRLALDQTHEQCNAVVKGKRGVTDLFLKNEALRRWSIVQPIVVDLLKDFHQKDGFSEDKFDWLHHEESC